MGKRILVVIGGSYVSGLEVVTLHLIKGLKASGHEVRCLVNGWNDNQFKGLLDDLKVPYEEAKLGWLYITKPLWTIDTLIHLPGAYLKSRKVIRNFKPDVLHFCNYGTVIMLSPLLKNKNCVYNLQEPHAPTRNNRYFYRLVNRRVKVFTAVSAYIEKVLIDLNIPKDKIRVIYNGVPATHRTSEKQQGERIIFAIVGQVASWKGHDTLVDAVKLLIEASCPAFEVKIFGNNKNAYAEELKKRIQEKNIESYFTWEGFVRDQDSIYDQSDVVIVPSLSQEPCSLTILESMMRKKGLIVSDRGGNPELVRHKDTGLIFSAGDPADLAGCLRMVLENPAMIPAMGKRAGQKALEVFTADRMTKEYVSVYAEMGTAGKPGSI